MSSERIKIGILKLGCIGAVPFADVMLDERAERNDIETRAFTSGSKMDPDICLATLGSLLEYGPDLVVVVSPNASLPGPTKVREQLHATGIPTLNVSDGPAEKTFYTKDEAGKKIPSVLDRQGFVILPMDPMIGARREFLDPSEMVLFNAHLLQVFAATGVTRLLTSIIDDIITSLQENRPPSLPTMKVSAEDVIASGDFSNPYAAAKAYAAIKILEGIAKVTTTASFKVKKKKRYVPMVTAGHEMMRAAAILADEAREIEKSNDSLLRTPHSPAGLTLRKRGLLGPYDSTDQTS
ncbi:MAG: F420-dependent methylenetetrahydromethanopterin dehydrogenase [Candidatus Thorarchaeota archaeon]|nr:F420-dependent methylenetetrahydromethanopterin dehydrogenase [Candidatus Thorarchaeota archaeon]